jgi:formate dehydrogenase major subunit
MSDNLLVINGQEVHFKHGQTILQAARSAGIDIPTLCHLKDSTPTGACRVCVVELDGARSLMASCTVPAAKGMVVRTETPLVVQSRKTIIELMLSSGRHEDCLVCPSSGDCRLQELAFRYQVKGSRYPDTKPKYPMETVNPLILRNFDKCVLCGRCVQACRDVQVNDAIDFGYRGARTKIIAKGDLALKDSDCVFCGQCIQACPVGALVPKDAYRKPRLCETRKVRTTCPYCGVGCQQVLHVKNDRIVQVSAAENAEPNQGRLCVKGRFGYDFISSEDRLKTPLIRKDGVLKPASWDEALDLVVSKFSQIIKDHGPDAVGGVSCARSINEDSYQMQKLFRAVFKTNNIDHCARVCHAPTVAGLATTFGSGAMTNSLAEIKHAKLFFVIGANMTEAHPVASTFLKNAVRNGAKLILVDPRKHRLAKFADIFVPIKVGSDIAFLNSLMYVIISENLHDKSFIEKHTVNFEELKKNVMEYPPEKAAEICGISPDLIVKTARLAASVKPMMLLYTLGLTEHTCGRDNVASVANLQMILGNLGIENGGVNPLRGQNNVQGACDMGALPNVFPGYQAVTSSEARKKFEDAWNVDNMPGTIGLMIPQMLEGLVTKKIRGLYIFGENLANAEPHIAKVEHELESAEFLVVQDIFENETTRFAHVVLTSAAWSEDDGTFTNCERRVSRVRAACPAPGDARPNWWIFKEIARRMGHTWPSNSSREIWDNEISLLCPMFGGVKYNRIEGDGLQWPCPTVEHPGTRILHLNGNFTCGKGNITPAVWTPPAEVPDGEYPFVLSTGRRLYHYHTRTQTGRTEGLNELLSDETADISPGDAASMGILDGETIRVSSRRGSIDVKARVTDEVPDSMVWMAFHFRETNANWLTNPAVDPYTMTPEFKACAVKIEKIA